MHISAKRGIAIVILSVRLSVCNVRALRLTLINGLQN